MAESRHFQFGLACLVLAAFAGLAGFLIVFHYASSERPIEQFAIVMDAGSTQTRSSLFMIGLDVDRMSSWTSEETPEAEVARRRQQPLSRVIEVKQVSSCVNGGPLAQLSSQADARRLVDKCLGKFARHIRKLDFISSEGALDDEELEEFIKLEQDSANLDSDEVSDKLALLNHRVNSVTHLHLGATAGMRALSILNETRASEKISWIDSAIGQVNSRLPLGAYINKGYVNTISGSDEAAFGWASVNFVCDKLEAQHRQHQLLASSTDNDIKSIYKIDDNPPSGPTNAGSAATIDSIGTVELGGASSQIAYQVANWLPSSSIQNLSMESHNLELFNGNYKLATRSDLCLGMSQAILRTKYVLLADYFSANPEFISGNQQPKAAIRITNPCFQQASRTNLTSSDVGEFLGAPCLAGNGLGASLNSTQFKQTTFEFVGTGNTEQCNALLGKLLEAQSCAKYFSLCPKRQENMRPPPSDMPFVTISGYNKALQVLNLNKKLEFLEETGYDDRIEAINEKLGGYSIDYLEFVDETRKFCSIDVSQLTKLFPSMHRAYYPVNCLQLVYINKLLTEFYKFEPLTSWRQLKFLLFSVKPKQELKKGSKQHEDKNDIGWSLGLLLNATSEQFSSGHPAPGVFYHHGASLVFIMRTTVFLMLACCLLAICLIVFAVVGSAYENSRSRRSSYIDHSYDNTGRFNPN